MSRSEVFIELPEDEDELLELEKSHFLDSCFRPLPTRSDCFRTGVRGEIGGRPEGDRVEANRLLIGGVRIAESDWMRGRGSRLTTELINSVAF